MSLAICSGNRIFRTIHGRNLIYNTCWEDPRLDRIAMDLGPEHAVMVITSAGCNALDYALTGAAAVHAVDVNPRQNALLDLKMAGIRGLRFDDFFRFFGEGRHPGWHDLYTASLRPFLSPSAVLFWDKHIDFFSGAGMRASFYFHGTTGLFAFLLNLYITHVRRLRPAIEALLACRTIEEQRDLYNAAIHERFWTGWLQWLAGRETCMALLGVPRPQIEQIRRHYRGIMPFVIAKLTSLFTSIPLVENYFWRLYLTGSYTRSCCPEYLREDQFERLRDGLVDRVHIHTATVQQFLESHPGAINRFVLLDHLDWLSLGGEEPLRGEWQAILDRAAPEARIIWRSGGLRTDFLDPLLVVRGGRHRRLGDLLNRQADLAAELHARDRVHTYGSFHIADLAPA